MLGLGGCLPFHEHVVGAFALPSYVWTSTSTPCPFEEVGVLYIEAWDLNSGFSQIPGLKSKMQADAIVDLGFDQRNVSLPMVQCEEVESCAGGTASLWVLTGVGVRWVGEDCALGR